MGSFFGCCNGGGGSSGSGGGIGGSINYAPAAGVIDPTIAGFVAAAGASGTGRIKVTLSGNTSFEGLPKGADGQQLFIMVVSGNFTLTLLEGDGATAQAEILASTNFSYGLGDTAQLFYDTGLSQWVLVA